MATFPHQYLLSRSEPAALPESFVRHGQIGEYAMLASQYLPVAIARDGPQTTAVLGDIYDPRQPAATNDEIARRLVQSADRPVFECLQRYTGRYVVVMTDGDRTLFVPDAFCHRRVQFTADGRVITPSPKLFLDAFGLESDTAADVATFVGSEEFWANDAAWPGTRTIDRRLTRLLPNHYLDVSGGSAAVHRRPLSQPPVSSRQDVLELIADTLTGTLTAISARHGDVRCGLSAGWDSRAVMAAAIASEAEPTFFTSLATIGRDLNHPDVRIAHALAERFDLDYRIVRPRSLADGFVALLEANYHNPRQSAGTRTLQHYHDDGDISEMALVTGNGAEILRAYYPVPLASATPELLADLYHYPDSAFAREAFTDWLDTAAPYAEATGINIFDLFYWEQRIGNWMARRAHEQDIAVSVFSPFSSYDLLLAGLSVPRSERKGEGCPLFADLIETLQPEALTEAVNPTTDRRVEQLKTRLKQAAHRGPRLYRGLRWYRTVRT